MVLILQGFNSTGITQSDAVNPNNADVDIVQDICQATMGTPTLERFTQTTINAVFSNQEASDIRIERYTVDFGRKSGLPDGGPIKGGVFTGTLSGNIAGGRCGGATQQCAIDADCASAGAGVTCVHNDTTINGVLLVDFDVKARIIPGTYNVVITFFGSDANQSFQTSTGYVIRFDDFNNCSSGSGAGLS